MTSPAQQRPDAFVRMHRAGLPSRNINAMPDRYIHLFALQSSKINGGSADLSDKRIVKVGELPKNRALSPLLLASDAQEPIAGDA